MFRRIVILSCALLLACAGRASAADPFAAPVKDCHPCRFSPGPGQPTFDLSFAFQGSGDQKALTAFIITRAGGGQTQHLAVGPLAVADFPDGFILDDADMNFDKLGDLSIVTEEAADNVDAAYWIYEPATKRFVALERISDGDNEVTLRPGPDHLLFSHVKGGLLEYTEYAYRISGHRAVAVSTESRKIEGGLIVDVHEDLAVAPNRVTRRTVVGFMGDSPARRAFLQELDAASDRALALYRRGNPAGAAATVAAIVKGRELALVTSSYPITGDPGDLTLVRQFNDYGFYLEQAKQPKQAIGVLAQVTDVDPDRTVAYLNLADADYAVGRMADAKANYTEYQKRMAAAGKLALMPARVAARLGSARAPR